MDFGCSRSYQKSRRTREYCNFSIATSGSLSLRRIYVLGGWSVEDVLSGSNLNRVYNPENNSWTFGTPMPTGRIGVALAVVNDAIFAIGGNPLYISTSSANEQYFPFGYGTTDPAITLTPSITSSSPTPTPTVPEIPYYTFALALVFGLATIVMLVFKKACHVRTNPAKTIHIHN